MVSPGPVPYSRCRWLWQDGFDTLSGRAPGVEAEAQMSQGTLDLRWIARRIWLAVGAVAVWGLLGGIAVATLHPPVLTSTADTRRHGPCSAKSQELPIS